METVTPSNFKEMVAGLDLDTLQDFMLDINYLHNKGISIDTTSKYIEQASSQDLTYLINNSKLGFDKKFIRFDSNTGKVTEGDKLTDLISLDDYHEFKTWIVEHVQPYYIKRLNLIIN